MLDPKDLFQIAAMATKGEADHEWAHSLIQAGAGKASIMKDSKTLPVLDANGDALIVNERYTLKGKTVLIKSAHFGCGNIADTYYHVYFLQGEDMEERRICIEGKGSPFTGFTYQGDFTPITK